MTRELARYNSIKYLLVAVSVGTSSAALLQGSWVPWGIASIVVVLCIGWWLWRARGMLSRSYLKAETYSAVPSPRDKWVWGDKKPRIRDLAIPFFFLSFGPLWFAYRATVEPYKSGSGGISGTFLDLIYAYTGVHGIVLFWVIAWAIIMTPSAEIVIGSRMNRAHTP